MSHGEIIGTSAAAAASQYDGRRGAGSLSDNPQKVALFQQLIAQTENTHMRTEKVISALYERLNVVLGSERPTDPRTPGNAPEDGPDCDLSSRLMTLRTGARDQLRALETLLERIRL